MATFIVWLTNPGLAIAGPNSVPVTENMMITVLMTAQDNTYRITMADSEAARSFIALLPMTLKLSDYHGIEKVADLPKRLDTSDAPAGIKPEVGDVTYYSPWGNLAIFTKGFGYASGLVLLGRIEGGAAAVRTLGNQEVRLELAP
ncbi:cyclophilin-like fold protein [Pokkaliibacter sp. CJK22405]|uniref:cyclophilin-like fold protein n=1 Tax=Pokkaliibacter sp. CJK22405 TaxID=3384615 RepID=UPI0039849C42